MEIVICLLKEAIDQYRVGEDNIGDKCVYLVVMLRTGVIEFSDPIGLLPKRE